MPDAAYLDPNNQMLANWWEAMYGPDYNTFGSQIDYRTNQFFDDRARYQGAADQGYNIGGNLPNTMQWSPEERNAIAREQERYGYMTTPEEFTRMQRTADEQNAISGDPYAGYNSFQQGMGNLYRDLDTSEQRSFDTLSEQDRNLRGVSEGYSNQLNGRLDSGANAMRGATSAGYAGINRAIDTGASGIRSAANSPDLYLDPTYSGRVGNILTSGEGAAHGALDSNEAAMRGIYGNNDLLASEDFMNNYQFGDQDVSDLEALAGTAAGSRYRTLQGEIERRAAAGGQTSAAAMATIKDRFSREAAQEAADAVLKARAQGRQIQLDTTRGREDVRLGAQQNQSNLAAQSESALGARRLNTEMDLTGRRYGAESETENMRLNATGRARQMQMAGESDIMRARQAGESDVMHQRAANEGNIMQAGLEAAGNEANFNAGNERYLGTSRLNTYNSLLGQRVGVGEFGTQGAAGYQAAGENAASARAANNADTRAETERYAAGQRYGQGMTTSGAVSQAELAAAQARLAGEQERRGYLTGMTGLNTQSGLTSQGQRQQQFATRFSGANQASGQAANYRVTNRQMDQAPKPWERIVSAGLGAVAGVARAAGGNG